MKNIIAAVLTLGVSASLFAGNGKEPWRDPTVSSINRLPARSFYVPCRMVSDREYVAYTRSLDGTWDFKWKPDVRDEEWEEAAKITVPGCWQLQGDYDPPLYTNVTYPIRGYKDGDPMADPPKNYTSYKYRNPVGLYSRAFTIPADWKGRRIVVRFLGVSSAMYVRVNGKEIGYSEDSRLPAEFDITDALRLSSPSAPQLLEVEVIKHSDGSFLEDQDFWRLSGIFRSVYLVAEEKDAPKDIVVETKLSDDLKTGKAVFRDENGKVLLEKEYRDVLLWDAGSPALYRETVKTGSDYRIVEFGFRKVEIRDSVVYVNGKRILIKGVNRHEMEPETGYAVTQAGMEKDLAIMHDLNVNAVRTCHYPDHPLWYDLCDKEGFYVCCEANVEAHGVKNFYGNGGEYLPANPLYHDAIVERQTRMVRTFRNHPSIIFWSLGNESGDGPAMSDGYKAIKALDATRPVQYEGAQDSDHSDIKCPMYHRPWVCEGYVKNHPKKPFILCEYIHAMGNSTGDIQSYWKLAEKYPSFQGGFIWDFADQALWKNEESKMKNEECRKVRYLAYGGDYGDQPNDDNFNCNGIIAADRTYHPGAYEVKAVYGGKLEPDAAPGFVSSIRDVRSKSAKESEVFRFNLWRAPTDNDRGWNMPGNCRIWKQATDSQKLPDGVAGGLKVFALDDVGLRQAVDFQLSVSRGIAPLPRAGVTFTIPKDFVNVKWSGRGPYENYCDRNIASGFGEWSAKIGLEVAADQLNPNNYVEPGEQGYHTECDWVEFSNAAGKKIRVTALNGRFGFNAWPYSQESLEKARHMKDLTAEDVITVNIDAAQMGVGGDDSWGAKPHDQHMLSAGEYNLSFTVEGL